MTRRFSLALMGLAFLVFTPDVGNTTVGPPESTEKQLTAEAKDTAVDLPAGASTSWLAEVQKGIRRSEYNVTWQEETHLDDVKASYQAPNRAHNLRTYFTEDGVWVVPRTSDKLEWRWGLRLRSHGTLGHTVPVKKAEISVSGNRVEYKRPGITEWYVNDPKGLEQGFTLRPRREFGNGNDETWVSLKQDICGNLEATLNESASHVEFTTPGGVGVIHFGKLQALDASGKELPIKFSLAGKVLDIMVDTKGAQYPIVIDPLATSPAWFAESDQTDAEFGVSVSTAGDVNGDGFSDLVVGAHWYDGGEDNEGRAYVYHGSSLGLSTSAAWIAESNQTDAEFGVSVSTAGDVNGDGFSDLVVGAYFYDNGEGNEGGGVCLPWFFIWT